MPYILMDRKRGRLIACCGLQNGLRGTARLGRDARRVGEVDWGHSDRGRARAVREVRYGVRWSVPHLARPDDQRLVRDQTRIT